MSGQAGAEIKGRFYALFFGNSLIENVAPPPDDDGSHVAGVFAADAVSFESALAAAQPALDELFEEWAARGHVPIVAFDQPHEIVDGTLILDLTSPDDEDSGEAHFTQHHRGGPCGLSLTREVEGLQFRLQFLVTDRVRESELEPILQQVSELLGKAFD